MLLLGFRLCGSWVEAHGFSGFSGLVLVGVLMGSSQDGDRETWQCLFRLLGS